jgi:membrane protein
VPSSQRRWSWVSRLYRAAIAFDTHNQSIHAGHIAFVGLLSLFPFLIVLVAVAGLVGSTQTAAEALTVALLQMPDDVASAIGPVAWEIVHAPRGGILTLGAIAALWAASTGFEALRYAFDRAYGLRATRQIWWRRLQSLALTIAFAMSILLATLSLVVIPKLLRLTGRVLNEPLLAAIDLPWFGPLFAGATVLAVTMALFKVLPEVKLGWLEVLPGAIVTVVGWVVAVWAFELYLTHVAAYSVTYGSLGGVVAALMFFYVAAAILLFGCEVNAAGRRLPG